MQVPRGSNLEILAAIPDIIEALIKQNAELSAEINKLKSPEKYDDSEIMKRIERLEKALGEVSSYDDTELLSRIDEAVKLCKRDDSQYRELAEQLDIVKRECLKACKSAAYDDTAIKKRVSEISKRIDALKPYDDKEILKSVSELSKSIEEIEKYDDSEIKRAIESIKPYNDSELKSEIANAIRLCRRADSQYGELFEQIEMMKRG